MNIVINMVLSKEKDMLSIIVDYSILVSADDFLYVYVNFGHNWIHWCYFTEKIFLMQLFLQAPGTVSNALSAPL